MSRDAELRVADILEGIDRCQRYLSTLDGDTREERVAMARDAIEAHLLPLAEVLRQRSLSGTPSSCGGPTAQHPS